MPSLKNAQKTLRFEPGKASQWDEGPPKPSHDPVYKLERMARRSGSWFALFSSLMWLWLVYATSLIGQSNSHPPEVEARCKYLTCPDGKLDSR